MVVLGNGEKMRQNLQEDLAREIRRLLFEACQKGGLLEACFSGERFRLKGKKGIEVGIVPAEELNLLEAMDEEQLVDNQ